LPNNEENKNTLRTKDKNNKSDKTKKALKKEEMRLRIKKIVEEAFEKKNYERDENRFLNGFINKNKSSNQQQKRIKLRKKTNRKIKCIKKSSSEMKYKHDEKSVNDYYEYVCQNCLSKNVIVESYEGYLYLVCKKCNHAVLAGIDDDDKYDGPVYLEGSFDGTIDNVEHILEKDY